MIELNSEPHLVRLFVVRHGQTDHNLQRILQGHLDVPINETGRQQARDLALELAGVEFDAAICSDLVRCKETLDIIRAGNRHGLADVRYTSDLRERMMGPVQGMHVLEARDVYGDDYRNLGESHGAMLARVQACLAQFAQNCRERHNVLVVAHGGVIRALFGTREVVANCSVSVIDYDVRDLSSTLGRYNIRVLEKGPQSEKFSGPVDQLAL